MRPHGNDIVYRRVVTTGKRRNRSLVTAIGLSIILSGISGCSGPTAVDSFLEEYDAEPGACVGATFNRIIEDAEFECWRVVGIDDIRGFTEDLAVAVNDGTAPNPDRSFCMDVGILAPDAIGGCTVEWGLDDRWFAVAVERDLYSTELEALETTGEFPNDTVSTVVIARATSTLSPEGIE